MTRGPARLTSAGRKGWTPPPVASGRKPSPAISKAINLDLQRAELYEQRAEAFLQLCDFQSAMLNFRKVLMLVPAWEQPCLALLALVLDLQGQCLLDQELYREALEAFTWAAELQPHHRVFHQRSIVCLAALNKFLECLRMLNRDLEEDARNPDLYVLRASFYECFGQLALCHQDIQWALELQPQHGAAQALRWRLLRQGQEAKAEAVSKALCRNLRGVLLKISFAIESDPSAAKFFTLRGALLRWLKDFSAARKDLARARELGARGARRPRRLGGSWQLPTMTMPCAHLDGFSSGDRRRHCLAVDCFLRLGELAYVLADYQQVLELSLGDRVVRRRVAAALHEQGQQDLVARQYRQAEACFSAAIEHDPQQLLYYLCRARACLCPRRVEIVKEDAALSLWLDPTDGKVPRRK
ncbi:tetratricopeptide repeat protein 16 [Spheniscus humboldti]